MQPDKGTGAVGLRAAIALPLCCIVPLLLLHAPAGALLSLGALLRGWPGYVLVGAGILLILAVKIALSRRQSAVNDRRISGSRFMAK